MKKLVYIRYNKYIATIAAMGLGVSLGHANLTTYLNLDSATGLTSNGGAAITTGSGGKFGEAATLDGTDDYFTVDAGGGITGTAARTYAGWINPDDTSGGSNVFLSSGANTFGGDGQGSKFDVDVQDGVLEVGIGAGRSTTTASVSTSAWQFAVVTVGAGQTAGDIISYVNGIKFTSSANTRAVNTADASIRIGANAPSAPSGGVGAFWDGLVDDVSIWNVQLTDDEITSFFDVGNDLAYTANLFDQLRDVHEAGSGSTIVGALKWEYATGLTGDAGLSGGDTLILDATANTGLVAVAVPEPSSYALLAGLFGLAGVAMRRR